MLSRAVGLPGVLFWLVGLAADERFLVGVELAARVMRRGGMMKNNDRKSEDTILVLKKTRQPTDQTDLF